MKRAIASILLLSVSHIATAEQAITGGEFITAQSSRVGATVSLGGTIIPHREVNLVAKMPGDVLFIAGEEGDQFKQGDRLASQDIDAMMAKRAQAEAQLASADAGIRNAHMQLRNEIDNPNSQPNAMMGGLPSMMTMFSNPMRNMSGRGDSDTQRQTNLYGMNVQVETATNAYNQALAAIRELDENIEQSTIIAPFDGVILRKMVEVGQPAQPGVPLFLFGDTSALQIRADVPARLVRGLYKGMQLSARLDHNDQLTPITVARIFPMADMMGHTVTVKFDLPNDAPASPGMYTEVIIPDPGSDYNELVTVPRSAIVWRGSLPALFVQRENGSLEMRLVRIGDSADNGWSSVLSGVQAGERVLANPSSTTTSNR
jgi:multidrug efflux pump subunit AcrA (membrane-fusion protein)